MAIIPRFYMDAVVSIGVNIASTNVMWVGTGFFVTRKTDANNARPFLITNRHVINNQQIVYIRMKEKDTNNLKTVSVPLVEGNKSVVIMHNNPEIDIAVIPLNGEYIVNNNFEFPAFDIDEHALTSVELRENGVDEGTLIHMLGFPLELVNNNSTRPICRLGCIARIDEEQICEKNNILVDIQNFPGSSGSPVISRPELVSIEGTKSLTKAVLIGIAHSYIPYKEKLINSQTGEVVDIRSENSGIALVHPTEYIRDIINAIQPKATL